MGGLGNFLGLEIFSHLKVVHYFFGAFFFLIILTFLRHFLVIAHPPQKNKWSVPH